MMIMRLSRKLPITRFNNKRNGWLIIVRRRGNLLFIFIDHGCLLMFRKGCRYTITSLNLYVLGYFVVVRRRFSRFVPSEIVEKNLQCIFFLYSFNYVSRFS